MSNGVEIRERSWRANLSNWCRLRPLLLPMLFAIGGVLMVEWQSVWGLALVGLLAILSCFIQTRIFILSLISLCFISYCHHLKIQKIDELKAGAHFTKDVHVEGVVVEKLRGGGFFLKVSGGEISKGSKLLVSSYVERELGDRLAGKLYLKIPQPVRNPGGFDKRKWLRTKGVILEGRGRMSKIGEERFYSILSNFPRMKDEVKQRLTSGIENEASAKIIQSMFLGERFGREDPIAEDFRLSGAMHVFAVSGLHVMLVAAISIFFLNLLPIPKWSIILSVVLVMILYTGVTGWGTPAIRATVMATLYLSGAVFYRKAIVMNSVAASAILLLAFDSLQLFTVGFQLTYLVVFSILTFTEFWRKRFALIDKAEPFLPYVLQTWWQRMSLNVRMKLKDSLAVSFSAWMGSAPLVMLYFKLFSPIALLIGVPVVVLLTCIMWLSFLSLVIGCVSSPMARQVNKVNGEVAGFAHRLTAQAADVRYGHYVLSSQPEESIEVLDVKGGGAVYLNLGDGVMLDTGGSSSRRGVRDAVRQFKRGVGEIWISHQDGQHYRGIKVLVDEHEVDKIRVPDLKLSSSFEEVLKSSGSPVDKLTLGSKIEGEGFSYEVIYEGFSAAAADDRSVVVKLTWKGRSFLFINDIGFYSEKEMLESRLNLAADILICGKHVDQQSPSEEFIRAVNPMAIVATNHRFSFLEQRYFNWINMVKKLGVKLMNQSDCGAVSMRVEDDKIVLKPMIGEQVILGQIDR